MPQIKFSNRYSKMHGIAIDGAEAMLMQVFKVNRSELTEEFIVYDTSIWEGGFYELPKGELLVLFFRTIRGAFTTIRRWTKPKEDYYKSKQGQWFRVTIKEQTKNG